MRWYQQIPKIYDLSKNRTKYHTFSSDIAIFTAILNLNCSTCILHGYANVMYVSLPAEEQIRCVFDDHYANMSVQYTAIFHGCKNDNFRMKILIFFLFLLKT